MPPLSVVSPSATRGVQRGEQRRSADEQAGVERVVSRQILADRDDAIAGEPDFRGLGGDVGTAAKVDREERLAGGAGVRSRRDSTCGSKRWSPISRANGGPGGAARSEPETPFSSCHRD